MQLTQFTDYALRTLIYVALRKQELCTIAEIAQSYQISKNHLVKVVHRLSQLGLLKTTRGNKGGMTLNGDPRQINLGDLVQKLEPNFYIVECFDTQNKTCLILPACHLKRILNKAKQNFLQTLKDYTLADLITNSNQLNGLFARQQ
jgi:Rrf2 family transcriptional regulator, nitric oxide-sensitive transcriptional repressor